ncbi:hypothetical protein CUZ56_01712 [Saezia sanguinis]|uniref:Uncharacterized protein n=1 Tax=Saezia sanguinis TaxID=1965230 RepID=A0A433SDV6_9BURK|nr:hypothetical protein [Saezia sanguinis]RUS66917.1 hypothetical protein CUZ56_01712 [Saezia sanguinis]
MIAVGAQKKWKWVWGMVGLVCLLVGLYLQFRPAVSAEDREACEAFVRQEYGHGADMQALQTLLDKCGEPGMVAMMSARADRAGASQMGQHIAAANQGDSMLHLLSMFLIGLGAVGCVLLVIPGRMLQRNAQKGGQAD